MNRLSSLLLAGVVCALPASGVAQVLIGSTGGSVGSPGAAGAIVSLDPSDASGTILGTPFEGVGVPGIEQAPDGTVYAVSAVTGAGVTNLLQINPANGELIADLGPLLDASGNACGINDLAYHPQTGVLYALAANNTSVGTRCGVGSSTGGYLLTIDTEAVEYTVIGRDPELGNNSGGIAFDDAGTLWFTPGWNDVGTLHTLDLTDGSIIGTVALSEDLGFHGLEFDPTSGNLFASLPMTDDCCSPANFNIYTIDPATGTVTLVGSPGEYSVHDMIFLSDAVQNTATFRVTKLFSDGREDEVEVTLSCNSGLPLEQDFTIAGGDPGGVNFVVTELQGTETTCTVTESGAPDGYTPSYDNGSVVSEDSCTYTNVVGGPYTCVITNTADPATFTVHKDWVIEGSVGDEVIEEVYVTIYCNNAIQGGYDAGDEYAFNTYLEGDGDHVSVSVDTTERSAECRAVESVYQSGVESEDDCGTRTIPAGGTSSCTFTNTVFFEGIPTLSQYGMALMALLMLGVGFVGLRRIA